MRLLLLCVALFVGIAVAQRFGGQHAAFNAFPGSRGPRFGFGRRPAPQQNSFFGPSQPSFNRQPNFNGRPSFGARPTFDSRPSFGGRPSFSGGLHEVSAPAFDGRPTSGFSGRPSGGQVRAPASAAPGGGKGNHVWKGKNYLLTWRSAPGQKFSYSGAKSYCARQGMRIVSLDSHDKSAHFIGELGRDNGEYFWAGGKISGDGGTLQWENGRSERINRGDDRAGGFWSSGGRNGPQPETGGECLAILNNVYNDGIKWHDVACSHTKPTICEE